jgi:hypothetical protein
VRSALLAACAAIIAGLLGGCSEGRITSAGGGVAPPPPVRSADRPEARAAKAPIGAQFASAALDDRRLGEVRGGLNTSSGLVVNFSFQEATYVNHNLAQSIVVPTVTVAQGSNSATMAATTAGSVGNTALNSIAAAANNAAQMQVNAAARAGQSLVNSGVTSVVSSLGGGGVTNVITNTANNQLVQQVITANIGVTGLSQQIQQSVAATVLSRVAAANSQFR